MLCAFFVTAGVGYVWYKNQISLLGHQIKERENRLAELERGNKVRRDQLARFVLARQWLDERVRKLNLGLGPPALTQVIRLVDASVETPQTLLCTRERVRRREISGMEFCRLPAPC